MRELSIFDITSLDFGATPPSGWLQETCCEIMGAKTFHWFKFVRLGNKGSDSYNPKWIISESIQRGVELSFCEYPEVLVYSLKYPPIIGGDPIGEADLSDWLLNIHAEYTDLPYDWVSLPYTGLWWIAREFLGLVIPPLKNRPVNCQEWVNAIAVELDVPLIEGDAPPHCVNLEQSPHLEFKGVLRQ